MAASRITTNFFMRGYFLSLVRKEYLVWEQVPWLRHHDTESGLSLTIPIYLYIVCLKVVEQEATMNLDQLPYFIAIASYGSLSAASRHLNVTQQALSSYLTELEKTVDMPLFFRNS